MIRRNALLVSTVLAILVIVGLAFAPNTVRIVAIVVFFLAYILGLWWLFRRPLTDTDLYCASVDEELDRRRIADAQERAAADHLRQQHNVTALPQREPARVVTFPTNKDDAS